MQSRTGKTYKRILNKFFLLLLVCSAPQVYSAKLASIIIDDLGNNYEHGQTLVDFPAPLTLAFLPQTDFAKELASLAHENQKEVMLHLPLQSVEHHKHSPGTLDLHMSRREFVQQLKTNIVSIPHVRGINNHMGSLLTRHPGHMSWLMEEIAKLDDLYFVDSLTSNKSVAAHFATEHHIPNLIRDIFLDPDHSNLHVLYKSQTNGVMLLQLLIRIHQRLPFSKLTCTNSKSMILNSSLFQN
jgi:polysaccharide deacetylase 2 family uncharacterized protein YibQ